MTKSKAFTNKTYLVKDRITDGICLMDGNSIVAKNIKPESICFYFDSGLSAAIYDVPISESGYLMNPPVHFFVYSQDTRKTYVYKKDSVVLSSTYKYPICRENNKIKRFAIEDGIAKWVTICEVYDSQRVFKDKNSRLCIESKVGAYNFELPIVIDKDMKIKSAGIDELRRFLWKYIYYGLADSKMHDCILRDLVIPENDTIDSIKGLIKSIEEGKRKVRNRPIDKKADNSFFSSKSPADIDEMIKEIDRQIELLEEEERKDRLNKNKKESDSLEEGNSSDIEEKKEIPLLDEIINNGENYQFCSDNKLEVFKDFIYIIANNLGISSDDNLTNMLIRLINVSRKVFPTESNIVFPSNEFNNLLLKLLSDMDKKGKEKFKRELLGLITNIESCIIVPLKDYYYDAIYKTDDKKNPSERINDRCDTKTMIDNSIRNRIGWIEYDASSGYEMIGYVEAVPFGELRFRSEIHPSVQKGSKLLNLKKDFSYAEVYYDLNDKLFHVINPDDIPDEKIFRCMSKLEGGDVDYVISSDYPGHQYSNPVEEDVMEFNIDLNNPNMPETYIPRYKGVRYAGVAILNGTNLYIKRIRMDDDRSSLKRFITEKRSIKEQGEKFIIRYMDLKGYQISSSTFDMSVISLLVKCFSMNKWNWECSESE